MNKKLLLLVSTLLIIGLIINVFFIRVEKDEFLITQNLFGTVNIIDGDGEYHFTMNKKTIWDKAIRINVDSGSLHYDSVLVFNTNDVVISSAIRFNFEQCSVVKFIEDYIRVDLLNESTDMNYSIEKIFPNKIKQHEFKHSIESFPTYIL